MGILGQAMGKRIILLLIAACGVLAGCGNPGSEGKPMSPEEEANIRKDSYTPEQEAQRAQRPK